MTGNTRASLPAVANVPDGVSHGNKTVTAAGTAEALPSLNSSYIYIRALSTNTGNVYIGDSTVDSSDFYLAAGEGIDFPFDLAKGEMYIDVDTNGEGVHYMVVR